MSYSAPRAKWRRIQKKKAIELKTTSGHMMPPQAPLLHVRNGLARPVDE